MNSPDKPPEDVKRYYGWTSDMNSAPHPTVDFDAFVLASDYDALLAQQNASLAMLAELQAQLTISDSLLKAALKEPEPPIDADYDAPSSEAPYGLNNPYGFTLDDIERILLEFKRGTTHFDSGDDAVIAWIIREWRSAQPKLAELRQTLNVAAGQRDYAIKSNAVNFDRAEELRKERDATREALERGAASVEAMGWKGLADEMRRAALTPAPADAKAKETSICAVCGEHANEHGAISHTFVGAKARSEVGGKNHG